MSKKLRNPLAWGALVLSMLGQTTSSRPAAQARAGTQSGSAATTQSAATSDSAFDYETAWDSSKPIDGRKITKILHVEFNDSDQFVFLAHYEEPSSTETTDPTKTTTPQPATEKFGIFTKDKFIAGIGEPLPNGATALDFSYPFINNNGQIAFEAVFHDPDVCGECAVHGYFVDNQLKVKLFQGDYHSTNTIPESRNSPLVLTPQGEILLPHMGSGWLLPRYDNMTDLGDERYPREITRNGVNLLPRLGYLPDKGDWDNLLGNPIRERGIPVVSPSGDGDIAFVGQTPESHVRGDGIYTTTRGKISDVVPSLQRFFMNAQGEVAFKEGREWLYVTGQGRIHLGPKQAAASGGTFADPGISGFNDRDEVLMGRSVWKIADIMADPNAPGKKPEPPLPGASYGNAPNFIYALTEERLNNRGHVILGATSGAKNGNAYVVIATPRAASGQPALITTMIDPVTIPRTPDATSTVLLSPDELVGDKAREVAGVAADGAARVVLRIPTQSGQNVYVSICEKMDKVTCEKQSPDEYGALALRGDVAQDLSGRTDQHITAPSETTPKGPEAFAVYRAPLDFVRQQQEAEDSKAASRSVFIRMEIGGQEGWMEVKVIRPPVILVHGYNSNSTDWGKVSQTIPISTPGSPGVAIPLDTRFESGLDPDKLLSIYRANYGQPIANQDHIKIETSEPILMYTLIPKSPETAPSGVQLTWNLNKITLQSHFGFTFVAPCVFDQMDELLANQLVDPATGYGPIRRQCLLESLLPPNKDSFRKSANPLGKPIAASRLDVIAHSMGGLVSRQIIGLQQYKNDRNFRQGIIHKLVTLGTPHLGTPLTNLLLLPEDTCIRNTATEPPFISGRLPTVNVTVFNTVIDGVRTFIPGAALELSGNGHDMPPKKEDAIKSGLSPALWNLANNSPIGNVPTALVAGDMVDLLTSGQKYWILEEVRRSCPTDPLASRYARNKYDTIFDPNIYSKSNPDGSRAKTPNDGAVPVTSALNGTSSNGPGTLREKGYVHSDSIQLLSGAAHMLQDNKGSVMTHVRKLLNERTKSPDFINITKK